MVDIDPTSPESMRRTASGESGLSAIREKPVDNRSTWQQLREYLTTGINEDARYALGPHAGRAIGGLGSLGELLGPGADVRDALVESQRTVEAAEEGKALEAGVGGLSTLASLFAMALPGSLGGAKKVIKNNLYTKPVYHSTKKIEDIEKADKIYFVSRNPAADIGFHVATTPLAANQRIISNANRQEHLVNITAQKDLGVKQGLKESLDEVYEGKSNLLLKLKNNIKPVRVPDVSNFKDPLSWAETIAISKKDFPDKFGEGIISAESYGVTPLIIKHKGDELIVSNEYLEDIIRRDGKIDKKYIEDLVKMVFNAKDKILSKKTKFWPQSSVQDRRKWFEELKSVNKKHGYDSFVYKNKYEGWDKRGGSFDPSTGKLHARDIEGVEEDSLMLMYPEQVKYATASEFNPKNPQLSKKQGGSVVERNPYNYEPRAV